MSAVSTNGVSAPIGCAHAANLPSATGPIVPPVTPSELAKSVLKRVLVKRNPALIRPPSNDPRPKRDPRYIRELADNIHRKGLRNPPYIVQRGEHEEIVVGEHRRQATILLGWTEADFFLIEGHLSEADLAIERWQEAIMHTGFTSQERVAVYQTLIAQGLNRQQIADLLDTDVSTISRDFRTKGNLAPPLQADLESAKLGVSHAYILAMLPDQAAQLELAEKCYAGLLSRDGLYKRVKAMLGKKEKRPTAVKGRTPGGLSYTLPALLDKALEESRALSQAIKKAIDLNLGPAAVPGLLRS